MVPKILLLVNSDPSGGGIGELFLQEIGKIYPASRLVRYSTVQKRQAVGESTWLGFRSITRYVNSSRWPILSSLSEWAFILLNVGSMATEVESLVKEEGIDIVWAVLSSGSTITLVDRLIQNRNLLIVSTIWDDPKYFARNQCIDPFTWRNMHAAFARVVRGSLRLSVMCESMQMIYRECYGVESVIMRHGVEESNFRAWKGNEYNNTVRIGFAGSLYAKKEWNALLKMLDSVGGRIAGKDVRISFIGRKPRTGVDTSVYVDYLGYMSFDAALDCLSKSDIAYLPYWFDRRHSLTVKTSFPGKLSTYAACGIPVLYHGPLDSSVTPFIKKYPFGVCCHSLESNLIHATILYILKDEFFTRNASCAREQALEDELSRAAMLRRFCSLVGIDHNLVGLNDLHELD